MGPALLDGQGPSVGRGLTQQAVCTAAASTHPHMHHSASSELPTHPPTPPHPTHPHRRVCDRPRRRRHHAHQHHQEGQQQRRHGGRVLHQRVGVCHGKQVGGERAWGAAPLQPSTSPRRAGAATELRARPGRAAFATACMATPLSPLHAALSRASPPTHPPTPQPKPQDRHHWTPTHQPQQRRGSLAVDDLRLLGRRHGAPVPRVERGRVMIAARCRPLVPCGAGHCMGIPQRFHGAASAPTLLSARLDPPLICTPCISIASHHLEWQFWRAALTASFTPRCAPPPAVHGLFCLRARLRARPQICTAEAHSFA
jgi:hypothetical protein